MVMTPSSDSLLDISRQCSHPSDSSLDTLPLPQNQLSAKPWTAQTGGSQKGPAGNGPSHSSKAKSAAQHALTTKGRIESSRKLPRHVASDLGKAGQSSPASLGEKFTLDSECNPPEKTSMPVASIVQCAWAIPRTIRI